MSNLFGIILESLVVDNSEGQKIQKKLMLNKKW